MVPEKVIECSAIHRQFRVQRTFVVMIVLGFDFELRRYATWAVKDADLSSTGAEVEVDVMHVDWPV